jgi:hypothetical protein
MRIAALVLALASGGGAAHAAMVVRGGVATQAESALLRHNPALAAIAATSPEMLGDVLDMLAKITAHPSGTRGGLLQLDADEVRLLRDNPALFQAWRSSPEASADLLQLIRVAAGGGKPRK